MQLIYNATGFNTQNALSLAEAAQLVYEDWAIVEKALGDAGYTRFKYFDVEGTQAFVAANDKVLLLSFRGTEPDCLADIMTDLMVRMVPGPFGNVHSGFKNAWKLIESDVLACIHAFRKNNQSLWVTGHSLGGALAKLATAYIATSGIFVNGLYTFGQPRVGDQKFSDHFNVHYKNRTFRFVNNNDLVTRVPMRSMGFRHAGTHYYFDEKGALLPDDGSEWWNLFTERVKNTFEDFARIALDSVADHSMTLYYQLMKRQGKN